MFPCVDPFAPAITVMEGESSTPTRSQIEAEELIAELCIASGDNTEHKVALHKYEYGSSVKEIEKKLQQGPASKIEVLRSLLTFLNNNVIQEEIPKKKCDIAHAIVCRIQNLLPENCGICNDRFCLKLAEKPFLPCSKCGQSSHKKCIIEMTKPTIEIDIETLEHEEAYKLLVNPHNIPGVHLLCKTCEDDHIPSNENITESRTRSNTLIEGGSTENSTAPPHQQNQNSPQPAESDNVTHSQQQQEQEQRQQPHGENQQQRGRTPKNDITCKFFAKGSCKHGAKGENCEYKHPEVCQKFIQFGTRQPRGCNLAKACSRFHPRMCINSLRSSKCLDQQCRLRHTKGTARHETTAGGTRHQQQPNHPTHQSPQLNYAQVASLNVQRTDTTQGQMINSNQSATTQPTTGHFLDALRLMKAELLQAMRSELLTEMDNRLNAHLLQIQPAPHPTQQILQQQSQVSQQQSQPQAAPLHNNNPQPRQTQTHQMAPQQLNPQQMSIQTSTQHMLMPSNQHQSQPTMMSQPATSQHTSTTQHPNQMSLNPAAHPPIQL